MLSELTSAQVLLPVLSIICFLWCPEILTISQCLLKCRVCFYETQLAQKLILDGKSKLPQCWFTYRSVMATISVILCLLRRKKKKAGSRFSSQERNVNLTENQASLQVFCRGRSRRELFLSSKISHLWSELRYMSRQGHTAALPSSKISVSYNPWTRWRIEELEWKSNFTEG